MLEILKQKNFYIREYEKWLNDSYISDEDKTIVFEMTEEEKKENFSGDLMFGTGGIRGKIGLGTNKLNKYNIRKISQAVSNYINNTFEKDGCYVVVISYDTRCQSRFFAVEAARVFIANKIYVYLFNSETPTPVLAYFTKELNAHIGIMITASHNPKEYNGYKIYDGFGMQLTSDDTEEIQKEIKKINSFGKIKYLKFDKFSKLDKKNLTILEDEIYDDYIKCIKKEIINKEILTGFYEEKQKLKVVYTPLNGTGYVACKKIFEILGITNVFIPENQMYPDENFTTLKVPNPEIIESFDLSIALAKKNDADIIFANDPDADRLGVVYKNKYNDYKILSGNLIGVLLLSYILKTKEEKLIEEFVAKTIVTTNIVNKICKEYGVEVKNTHTGFKNMGKLIVREPDNFIFALEESYGYLKGSYIADKDGLSSMMIFLEFLLDLKRKNMLLDDYIEEIYEKYSYFDDLLITKEYASQKEIVKIKEIMKNLREKSYFEIANLKVIKYLDYIKGEGEFYSDVLYYELEDGSFVCIRPSGTEPKIKIYINILGKSMKEVEGKKMIISNFIRKNMIKDLNF